MRREDRQQRRTGTRRRYRGFAMIAGAAAIAAAVMFAPATVTIAAAQSSAAQSAAQGPKAVAIDPSYDFGTVLSGPPLRHVFEIRNAGQGKLELSKVNASCGCTAAKPSRTELGPGETSEIAVETDTKYERGHAERIVTVATNDPAKSSIRLMMSGDIKPQVTAEPSDLFLGSVRHGAGASRQVVISDMVGGAAPFKIESVTNSSPDIKVTQAPRADGKPGAILNVAVASSMPVGPIADVIKIDDNRSPIRIDVSGVISGDLNAKPAQVSFGVLPHHGSAVRIIRLTNDSAHPVSVLGVDTGNGSVLANVEPVTPGKAYKITLTLRQNTPDGQVRGQLKIRTDDAHQPTVVVPFYGIVGTFNG